VNGRKRLAGGKEEEEREEKETAAAPPGPGTPTWVGVLA
jgi:hypothetical protein